jgi:hypothetical protein
MDNSHQLRDKTVCRRIWEREYVPDVRQKPNHLFKRLLHGFVRKLLAAAAFLQKLVAERSLIEIKEMSVPYGQSVGGMR